MAESEVRPQISKWFVAALLSAVAWAFIWSGTVLISELFGSSPRSGPRLDPGFDAITSEGRANVTLLGATDSLTDRIEIRQSKMDSLALDTPDVHMARDLTFRLNRMRLIDSIIVAVSFDSARFAALSALPLDEPDRHFHSTAIISLSRENAYWRASRRLAATIDAHLSIASPRKERVRATKEFAISLAGMASTVDIMKGSIAERNGRLTRMGAEFDDNLKVFRRRLRTASILLPTAFLCLHLLLTYALTGRLFLTRQVKPQSGAT